MSNDTARSTAGTASCCLSGGRAARTFGRWARDRREALTRNWCGISVRAPQAEHYIDGEWPAGVDPGLLQRQHGPAGLDQLRACAVAPIARSTGRPPRPRRTERYMEGAAEPASARRGGAEACGRVTERRHHRPRYMLATGNYLECACPTPSTARHRAVRIALARNRDCWTAVPCRELTGTSRRCWPRWHGAAAADQRAGRLRGINPDDALAHRRQVERAGCCAEPRSRRRRAAGSR